MNESGLSELRELLAGRAARMNLDRAALTLSTIEFPRLDIDSCVHTLDVFASEVDRRTRGTSNGREFITGANDFLFHELGLRGNAEDYYNPHNSCLNEVIDKRIGIPITLSVLYMEIARRVGRPVYGIGLPGHFVVQYDDGNYSTYIDPYSGGTLLSADQCYDLAQMTIGDPRVLTPVDNRQILFRMINNLRGIYFSRRSYTRALQVMDLLIGATPELGDQYKQRALLHLQLKQMRAAKRDIEKYLELAPEAEDRPEMEQQLKAVIRWLATLN